MSFSNLQFYFADKITKKRFGPFNQDQVLGFVLSIDFSFENLYVYTSNYGQWLPIQKSPLWTDSKLEQILKVEVTKTYNSTEANTNTKQNLSNKDDQTQTKTNTNTKNKSERRKNQRHPCRMEIVFSYNKKVFKTYTVDLSKGGVSLEKELPEHFLQDVVDVFLNWSEQNVRLKFQARPIVIDQKSHRIEFKDQNDFSRSKFLQLINYIQSGLSKKSA